MSDSTSSEQAVSLNIKGPSEIKLTVSIAISSTVKELKEEIAKQRQDIPADAQRLIYAGKVLKDEQPLTEYKLQNGHTVHLVKSASRSAPVTGNPSTGGASSTSGNSSAAAAASSSQGIPSNFGAGQQFTNNPLAALNRADLAGPHMANIGRQLFQGTGMNPNDPNMMINAMESPEFQQQMRSALRRPEVIDQMIAMRPEMRAMEPQLRQMLQNDDFVDAMTNPAMMRRMMQMQSMMGGGGGGGMGGMGGAPGGAAPFPPPGAFGTPSNEQQQQRGAGGQEGGAAGAGADPLASLFGGGGLGGLGGMGGMGGAGGAGGAGGMFDPQLMQQLFGGGGGGAGGAGAAPGAGAGGMGANPFAAFGAGLGGGVGMFGGGGGGGGVGAGPTGGDQRPPEERYASQLQSLRDMGFHDGPANLRALLISGGSVEGAIGILLGN